MPSPTCSSIHNCLCSHSCFLFYPSSVHCLFALFLAPILLLALYLVISLLLFYSQLHSLFSQFPSLLPFYSQHYAQLSLCSLSCSHFTPSSIYTCLSASFFAPFLLPALCIVVSLLLFLLQYYSQLYTQLSFCSLSCSQFNPSSINSCLSAPFLLPFYSQLCTSISLTPSLV